MALPQRQEPEEPRRDYGTLPPERPVRGAGAGFAWWWVLWLVIIGLFIWWAGWGWGGSGGWWWGNRGYVNSRYAGTGTAAGGTAAGGAAYGAGANGAGANVHMMSGSGVQVLNATDKTPFINQPFQVNDVPVQNKVDNQALWIGSNNSSPMLAILNGAGNSAANANISQGNLVNVTGTVEKAPPASQAQSQWHLSSSQAQRLEQEGAYIQASQVVNAQH